jgi:Tol biopolymer transport system component
MRNARESFMRRIVHLRVAALMAVTVTLAVGVALVGVEEPAQAAFPGENGRIAYYSCGDRDLASECEIYTLPPSGGTPTQLTNNTATDIYPAYSPDGTKIAFARWNADYEIWVMSHDGTSERQLTNNTTDDIMPAYSPDSTTIVYAGKDGNDWEIYAIPASGGSARKLTDNLTDDLAPVYSPDGTTIAYMHKDGLADGDDYEIETIPADGGTPTKLTDNTTADSFPNYSPNGATIAYGSHDGQDVEIYSIPATGGTSTRLTDNTLQESGPAYSPDGSMIVYMSSDGQGGDPEIYRMPSSGGTPIQLTDDTAIDHHPDWGVAVATPPDTTAPETSVDSGPQGPTNDATPTFTFSGSDNVTITANLKYQYRVDGGDWSMPLSTSTTANVVGLSDGAHLFEVRAVDEAGNEDLSPAERSFTVDTAVPTAQPSARGLVADSTLGTTAVPVQLTWSATDVGSGVAGYQLQQSVNGGAYADVSLPSQTTTTLTVSLDPGKTYRYQVRAQDKAGNWSAWAAGPSFTLAAVQEDGSGVAYPAGKWTRATLSGAYGGYVKHANVSGARAKFTFSGDEVAWVSTKSANRGKAEVWLDGVKVATVDLYSATTQTRRVVYSKGGLDPSKSHTLEVRVLGTKNAASSGKRVDVDAFLALR